MSSISDEVSRSWLPAAISQQRQQGDGQDLRHHPQHEVGVDQAEGEALQQAQRAAGVDRDVEQPARSDQVLDAEPLDPGEAVEQHDQHQRGHRQGPRALQAGDGEQQADGAGDEDQQARGVTGRLDRLAEFGHRRIDRHTDAGLQQQPADAGHEAADHRVWHQFQQAGQAVVADEPEKSRNDQR